MYKYEKLLDEIGVDAIRIEEFVSLIEDSFDYRLETLNENCRRFEVVIEELSLEIERLYY